MENPNYYAILTSEIRYSKSLSDFEKLLYADITALTNKNGYCTASNAYFANVFGKSTRSITRCISSLENNGFLVSTIRYKKGTKLVEERRLYLSTNLSRGIDKNVEGGIDKNVEGNNTSNNTNKKINKKSPYEELIELLKKEAPIKSKVTKTKEGAKILKGIMDAGHSVEEIKGRYIGYQEENGSYSKRITAYLEDFLTYHRGDFKVEPKKTSKDTSSAIDRVFGERDEVNPNLNVIDAEVE